jgi:hypothetical protein
MNSSLKDGFGTRISGNGGTFRAAPSCFIQVLTALPRVASSRYRDRPLLSDVYSGGFIAGQPSGRGVLAYTAPARTSAVEGAARRGGHSHAASDSASASTTAGTSGSPSHGGSVRGGGWPFIRGDSTAPAEGLLAYHCEGRFVGGRLRHGTVTCVDDAAGVHRLMSRAVNADVPLPGSHRAKACQLAQEWFRERRDAAAASARSAGAQSLSRQPLLGRSPGMVQYMCDTVQRSSSRA